MASSDGSGTAPRGAPDIIPIVARAVAQRSYNPTADASALRGTVYRNDPYLQGPFRQASKPFSANPDDYARTPYDLRPASDPNGAEVAVYAPPPPPPPYGGADAQPYMFYNGAYDEGARGDYGEDPYGSSHSCYRGPPSWEDPSTCAPRVDTLASCVTLSVHPRRRNSAAIAGCLGHVAERYTVEDGGAEGDASLAPADDRWDIDDCDTTAGQVCFRNRWGGAVAEPAEGSGLAFCLPFDGSRSLPPQPEAQQQGRRGTRGRHEGLTRDSVPVAQFDSCLLVPDSAEVTHTDLNGFCRYIPFPPAPEVAKCVAEMVAAAALQATAGSNGPAPQQAPPVRNLPIFFGQVLFSTTREQLTWLIHTLTGVVSGIVTNHSPGCFTCYFKSNEECAAVLLLNKRVLFDRSGVWIAQTPEQAQLLYVTALAQTNSQATANGGCRLPKGPLVVEVPMHKGMSSLPRRGPTSQQAEYRVGPGGAKGPGSLGGGRPKARTTQRMA